MYYALLVLKMQTHSHLQYIRSSSFFFPCFASKNDPSLRIMLSSSPSTPNKTMSNLLRRNLSRSRAVLQYTWRPENGEGSMCKLTHSNHASSFKFFFIRKLYTVSTVASSAYEEKETKQQQQHYSLRVGTNFFRGKKFFFFFFHTVLSLIHSFIHSHDSDPHHHLLACSA